MPYDAGMAMLNLAAPKFNNASGKDVLDSTVIHVAKWHSTELRDITTASGSEKGRKQDGRLGESEKGSIPRSPVIKISVYAYTPCAPTYFVQPHSSNINLSEIKHGDIPTQTCPRLPTDYRHNPHCSLQRFVPHLFGWFSESDLGMLWPTLYPS